MHAPIEEPRFRDLTPLLSPRSIAIVGASEQPGNLGGVAVHLLQKFGCPGEIFPVNPRRPSVHGIACVPSIADLAAPVDLAIIATGAESVPALVRECAAAGILQGIVWAGGYAETGPEGAALQANLVAACRETGFTLVGPNCIGIVNTAMPMVASFASFLLEAEELRQGDIAMVSQSGGLATMAQALAQKAGFGFRYMISAGNEAVLTAADYIHALAADSEVKVIALYIEGVRDGARFLAAVEAARAAGKPIVVMKGGATVESARAAAAHTGALAGESRVWSAIVREHGLIPVASLEELLDVVLFLSSTDLAKLPKGRGIAAITFGGGSGVLSADQCAVHGLVVQPLTPETRERLAPLVPPIASIANPIDVTPQVYNQDKWFACFSEALDVIAADPGIDIVFCQFGPMSQRGNEIATMIADLRERTGKTVCTAWPLAPRGAPDVLRSRGVHVFQEYERAIAVLGKLASRTPRERRATAPVEPLDWTSAGPVGEGTVISEHECHRLLAAAGIDVAKGRLATTAEEAATAAHAVGLPVAMKGISAAVTHRAAAGLVRLDLRSQAEVEAAYQSLTGRAAELGVSLDGVYVQTMIKGGIEIIVSAFRDPVFGVMVSCGAGGNLTEIIDDVTIASAPLDQEEAVAMLERLRIVRGARKLDPDAKLADLVAFVAHVSRVAMSVPWRRFVIEINPVKWRSAGVTAVDGLIIVEEP
ncbi:acetate--CoA ligase family protein [Chelatococcus sp. GCM10030263]|uniref:acetate--CoA ligase family protein n=1 Tax=Chelatococcus sp. GCM10030263 TaxID=3273387 RepID=UPI003616DD0E